MTNHENATTRVLPVEGGLGVVVEGLDGELAGGLLVSTVPSVSSSQFELISSESFALVTYLK